jgi:ATP-dependent protease HslVU (ClpYQ) peptidase subunit
MTCIVALEHEGVAYLGSDSFLGGAFIRDQIDRPKFFTKGVRFVVAFAGGLRGAQIVQHDIKFRKLRKGEDEEAYLVTEVSKKLQVGFTKAGANIKDEGQVDTHDATFLCCINGKIFVIQSDYSIIRSTHGFSVIGAGQEYALGALAATRKSKLSPHDKVKTALEVAAELSPQVCGPFHIIDI